MVFETDDRVELAFSEAGEGYPVVFVNGLGNLKEAWADTVNVVSRYFRVITYNLRNQGKQVDGHGDRYLTDRHVQDLQCLVDHLGLPAFVGVGISTGSRILVDFAGEHAARVRALVLMGASNDAYAERYQAIFRTWLVALLASPPEDLTPYAEAYLPCIYSPHYLVQARGQTPKIAAALDRTLSRRGIAANLRATIDSFAEDFLRAHRQHLVEAPTLLLQGELDFLTPPVVLREASWQFPKGTLKVLDGSGHNIRVERREEFEREMLNFLLDDLGLE